MNPDHRGKRTFTLKFNWIFFSLIAIHNFCSHFNAREDQYFQTEAWLFLNHFASHSNINWVIPTVSIFCASDKVASQSDCNTYFVGDASIKLLCEWLPLDMPETAQSSPQCLIGPKLWFGPHWYECTGSLFRELPEIICRYFLIKCIYHCRFVLCVYILHHLSRCWDQFYANLLH